MRDQGEKSERGKNKVKFSLKFAVIKFEVKIKIKGPTGQGSRSQAPNSVQVEVDFDRDLDSDRMPIFHGGLELPVFHGFDGLFVQAHAQATQHPDVARAAIGSDDQAESADTLVFRFASFFRKFRLWGVNLARRGNAATYVEDASASTAAFTGAETWSLA